MSMYRACLLLVGVGAIWFVLSASLGCAAVRAQLNDELPPVVIPPSVPDYARVCVPVSAEQFACVTVGEIRRAARSQRRL